MSERANYYHHAKESMNHLMALEKSLEGLSIEAELRYLVKLRVSQVNGCAFCVDMHSKELKLRGARELKLYHLPVWRESPLFSEREKAALTWAELATKLDAHGISDRDYDIARSTFSEKELSDLTVIVATINAWNRFGVAFRSKPGSFDKLYGLDKAGL